MGAGVTGPGTSCGLSVMGVLAHSIPHRLSHVTAPGQGPEHVLWTPLADGSRMLLPTFLGTSLTGSLPLQTTLPVLPCNWSYVQHMLVLLVGHRNPGGPGDPGPNYNLLFPCSLLPGVTLYGKPIYAFSGK